jgi:gliding motility-associated-like protein
LSRYILFLLFLALLTNAHAQQDVEFQLNSHLLPGKNILKVKRDFKDPFLWVLAQNNEVYRINSLNNDIVDYTTQFKAYNNLQYIDIAGVNKDHAFVATNSTNIIQYKNGNFKLISSADGIVGIVNSIGIDYTGSYTTDNTYGLAFRYSANTLLIGTNTGMCHYDYDLDKILPGSSHVPARVFETTYRSEMYSNREFGPYTNLDAVEQYPVIALTNQTVYGGWLWFDNITYGYNLHSAYYTNGVVSDNLFGYSAATFMNLYWGTDNGLFQNNRGYSYSSMWPHKQYLNGIKINKVTSILGLRAFGTSQNQGLIKENLLVGTPQGLYFSNSGYWNFSAGPLNNYTFYHYDLLGNKVINDICVNATSYTTSICEDGAWIATNDGLYLIKPDFGKYINSQTLQAIQFQNQSFNINQIELCAGSTIDALINNFIYTGNSVQWYKDGAQLPAQSNNKLTIDQSGDYYAVLYDPCSTYHVETNHLKVNLTTAPNFSFNYQNHIQACTGSTVELKADGSSTYQYRWYKNGILNGNTNNVQSISQDGKYKVEVSTCAGNWVSSKEIEIGFTDLAQPILSSNKSEFCVGDQATLAVNLPVATAYTINWTRDGNVLTNNINQTSLTTDVAGNYSVTITSNDIACSKISVPYSLSFKPLPTLLLEKSTGTAFCNGETINLKATYNTGNITWSTGENSPVIQIKNSGVYSAKVKTAAGCETNESINVQLYPKPILNMPDATLCEFTREQITLTAPPGFSKYTWNGQTGNRNFVIQGLGVVNLVVTDQNGCTASETINITNHCADVKLANTFTPNGDGVNDTWTIAGLNNNTNTIVTIFNRLGTVVFESRGYATPWNGEYQGKKLPTGTYYYVISIKGNKQVLSGPVTIIY